ncbi:PAS domain-containing protein [Thalassobaculum sp. OXR-137]|uniref:PAS domain-containing protein n=1 Tax=Thalassobaculum sp. OXR-137 TaxID=3100173 RepID=UPI002AC8C640|nr:PAS domain-containing protein [Thalassobaculum sp. OXR-137]WPZ36419.1 PAS domain-containing protein [Thalassobaculum sp. OXR-137]
MGAPDGPDTAGPEGLCGQIFEHWQSLARAGEASLGIPVRDQIDLLTLPKSVAGNFFLIERRGNRYFVRLAATALVDNMGTETTGKYLDQLMRPEKYPARKKLFELCTDRGCPVYYGATLAAERRDHIAFRRILLPLRSAPRGEIDLVCGAMEFITSQELSDGSLPAPSSGMQPPDTGNGLVFQRIFVSGHWDDWTGQPLAVAAPPQSR